MIEIYNSVNDIVCAASYDDYYYALIIRRMPCKKKILFVSKLKYVLFISQFNDLQIKGKANRKIANVLLSGLIL